MAPAIFALTCFTDRCICSKVYYIGTLRPSRSKLAAILRWRSSDTCNTANTRSQQRYCYIKNTINYADDHNEHHEHQLEDVKRVEHQLEDAKRVEGRQDDKDGGQEQERDSRHLGFKCNWTIIELSYKQGVFPNCTSLHRIDFKNHLYHAASLDGLLVAEEAKGGEEGAEDDANQSGCDGEHHLEKDALAFNGKKNRRISLIGTDRHGLGVGPESDLHVVPVWFELHFLTFKASFDVSHSISVYLIDWLGSSSRFAKLWFGFLTSKIGFFNIFHSL